jgi:hypothetical protein
LIGCIDQVTKAAIGVVLDKTKKFRNSINIAPKTMCFWANPLKNKRKCKIIGLTIRLSEPQKVARKNIGKRCSIGFCRFSSLPGGLPTQNARRRPQADLLRHHFLFFAIK